MTNETRSLPDPCIESGRARIQRIRTSRNGTKKRKSSGDNGARYPTKLIMTN